MNDWGGRRQAPNGWEGSQYDLYNCFAWRAEAAAARLLDKNVTDRPS
jgi:hypothetical protein